MYYADPDGNQIHVGVRAALGHGTHAFALLGASLTMPLLFSYGTLQEENVQLSTFGRLLQGQKDELPGFEPALVRIADPQIVAASGKTHHANVTFNGRNDNRVIGTVFEITDAELAAAEPVRAARCVQTYSRHACFGEAGLGIR